MGGCCHEVYAGRKRDVGVLFHGAYFGHEAAGDIEYAASGLGCVAYYANEAFEALCQQRLVDGYAGHTCVVDEHHVAHGRAHFQTHALHGVRFGVAFVEAYDFQ